MPVIIKNKYHILGLLGSCTYSESLLFWLSRLSHVVLHQIWRTKQDRREISSPL